MIPQFRIFLIDWYEQFVNRYRDEKNILPYALELKYRHSKRVAENARLIAKGLERRDEEILLAEGCGLVHDIGRFPQYVRYGSFHDAASIDHGKAGRGILENEKISQYFDADVWACIVCAVEYHNKKKSDIPANLEDKAGFFLRLIRDADKLDIMDFVLKSVASDGFSKLSDMLPHIGSSRELTGAVVEEILKTKTISVNNLRTVTDFMAMLVSWFYDINYIPTRRLAADYRILERIEQELPDTADIQKLLVDVKMSW